MIEEITPSRDDVWVSHHQLVLRGVEDPPPTPGSFSNGLIATGIDADGATILTGIAMGPVDVTVELAEEAPPLVLDEWEEVVEISIESSHGSLLVFGLDGDLTDLSNLASSGPGHYRLRVHARGRDANPDGTVRNPVEAYLFISWRAELAPDAIYKQSDACGEQVRQRP